MLDEEDLDLIGEANPEWERKTTTQVCRPRSIVIKFGVAELTIYVAKIKTP